MSLIQFLQQTILKDINHQILQEIQNQHSAVQSMLDNLSCLRQLNKLSILDSKIQKANHYLQIREQVFKCVKGQENQMLNKWIQYAFSENRIVSEFLIGQKTRIQSSIMNVVRQTFVTVGKSSYEQKQQNRIAKQYIYQLQHVKNLQINNQKPNRKQIIELSQLDQKFQQLFIKFEQKVNIFNEYIQKLIYKLKSHQDKIIRQFRQLLSFQPKYIEQQDHDTPLKQLQNNNQQSQIKYITAKTNMYRPKQRMHFAEMYSIPTRDVDNPYQTF